MEVFKRMFFTFFKGERSAYQIYEMLVPAISEHYDEVNNVKIQDTDPRASDLNKFVMIQLLTQFIDLFNYYPVKVNKLRSKNDSNELTYVMTSGMHGTKNERGEFVIHSSENSNLKSAEEAHMLKLLSLVSDKIRERFINLQTCFRFLDTNHSQSISINEFAQAIDHMRLKISFEDIKKLFNYIDKHGKGELGYEEFTLLLEERWRGIDPVQVFKDRQKPGKNPMETSHKPALQIYENCQNEEEQFDYIEKLGRYTTKVPLVNKEFKDTKINRSDAGNYLSLAFNMPRKGKVTLVDNHMTDIIKHDYLRNSIE